MRLKIGHLNVAVKAMTLRERIDEGRVGVFIPDLTEIRVWPGLTPEVQAETLIHEIMHACFTAHDLAAMMDEEAVCTALDGPLASVIGNNPKLLIALQRALCDGEPIVKGRKRKV